MTAAEAIAAFGPLEQSWTGPLTPRQICDNFPTEHVLAVLGLTAERLTVPQMAPDDRRCRFTIDGDDYRGFVGTKLIERDVDWTLFGNAPKGWSPLDVGDAGRVGNADRPSAVVRDGSVGIEVWGQGPMNGDAFVITQPLMKELMTVMITRWSFDTQQGDVVQYDGPDVASE